MKRELQTQPGRMDLRRRLTRSLVILSFVIFTIPCVAQEQKDTLRVLFIGNSYTYFNNLPQLVSAISESTGTRLITRKSVVGGSHLSEHWNGQRGLKSREMIENGDFDIVVLQEFSLGAVNEEDSLFKYVRLFSDLIRKNNGRPFLYMTWAREKQPEQQEVISRVYREAGAENDAVVVPVGEAWVLAQKRDPGLKLYIGDGSHPSSYGTFLAACAFIKSILNELPASLPGTFYTRDEDNELIFLTALDQSFINLSLQVAAEVTQEGVMAK